MICYLPVYAAIYCQQTVIYWWAIYLVFLTVSGHLGTARQRIPYALFSKSLPPERCPCLSLLWFLQWMPVSYYLGNTCPLGLEAVMMHSIYSMSLIG
jgi:hypothetical protein